MFAKHKAWHSRLKEAGLLHPICFPLPCEIWHHEDKMAWNDFGVLFQSATSIISLPHALPFPSLICCADWSHSTCLNTREKEGQQLVTLPYEQSPWWQPADAVYGKRGLEPAQTRGSGLAPLAHLQTPLLLPSVFCLSDPSQLCSLQQPDLNKATAHVCVEWGAWLIHLWFPHLNPEPIHYGSDTITVENECMVDEWSVGWPDISF